ncbi:hypothetical protein [Planctomycetes bacterium TBK1r]|uniref:Uncharacterized protein n=1 Tax=Stieleria magnilauensis TaxID=2527963 RepID=A0ABX5XZA6_9BACT|nr:hypothetical protein TBK1r_59760 [Planctomycetes bacterium TBK1r]QDV87027.1 hypothetical protein TBK1r_60540 [Planctomycetes bacterium TBK1r]
MATLTVHVDFRWDQDDPDGSECCGCGDRCYLQMTRMFFCVNDSGQWLPTEVVVCLACSDVLEDGE